MISFPNAKINLGLNILRKREDGYHDIETCLYPIPLTDVLEIVPSKSFSFVNTGLPVDNNGGDNLCIKAYKLIKKEFGISEVNMHLHKVIPMGAGLGGGSADAAFTLKSLNSLFELGIGIGELKEMAAELGSDCPFFIENTPAMGTGRGTELEPVPVDLKGKFLVLVFPDFPVSTAEAYANVQPSLPEKGLEEALSKPIAKWRDLVKNDFEESLFPKYPVLSEIKKELYQAGAEYAAMSGSGSTMFGIFSKTPELSLIASHRIIHL